MGFKLIKTKSFTDIFKGKFSKSMLKFNVKYMYKQATGRLNRLMKHFKSNSQILRNNKDLMNMDVDVNKMSRIELSSLLSRLNKFTQSKSSTIKGYNESRQRTIDSFHEQGYDFVNKKNLDDFLQFLDDFKESHDAELYGSDDAIKYYEQADRLGISSDDLKENMDLFGEYFREIEQIDVDELRKNKGEDISSKDIMDWLGIWDIYQISIKI